MYLEVEGNKIQTASKEKTMTQAQTKIKEQCKAGGQEYSLQSVRSALYNLEMMTKNAPESATPEKVAEIVARAQAALEAADELRNAAYLALR